MNPPPPDVSPEAAQRVANALEWLAKFAGSLLALWLFIARVGKPYFEWRDRQRATTIRAVLREELACLATISEREEANGKKLDLALARQDQVFGEIDLFVTVMADNRDRIDELNELLNEAGYASRDRRIAADRRRAADEAMAELQGRLRGRRRHDDQLQVD